MHANIYVRMYVHGYIIYIYIYIYVHIIKMEPVHIWDKPKESRSSQGFLIEVSLHAKG